MNKVILVISLLALGLSGFNTFLLIQITGKLKETGDKIEPVAKELEKLQQIQKDLPDGKGKPPIGTPNGNMPPGPGDTKGPGGGGSGPKPTPPIFPTAPAFPPG